MLQLKTLDDNKEFIDLLEESSDEQEKSNNSISSSQERSMCCGMFHSKTTHASLKEKAESSNRSEKIPLMNKCVLI